MKASGASPFGALLAAVMIAPLGSSEPPSSLAPPGEPARLSLVFSKRVVKACLPTEVEGRAACQPRTELAAGTAEVTLLPVHEASLRGREDRRSALTFRIQATRATDAGASGETREATLAPGVWRVSWLGASRQPTFEARAAVSYVLELEGLQGRCRRTDATCRLDEAPIDRTVKVSEKPAG